MICNRNHDENIDFTRVNKTEFWPAEEVIARGYAVAAFYNGDVDTDKFDNFQNGVHGILDTKRTNESWGSLAAWAWGASRCPFIVPWPAKIKQTSVSDQLVCTTDFFATAAQLLNKNLPDDATDSYTFLKDLYKTNKPAPVRNDIIHHSISGEFAIKKGDWKLIMCPGSGGWSNPKEKDPETQKLPPVQLYNIKTDIAEQRNVYATHPEIVA